MMGYIGESPEGWQHLWLSRVAEQGEAWNEKRSHRHLIYRHLIYPTPNAITKFYMI